MPEDNQTMQPQPARLRPTQPPEVVLAGGTQTTGELKAEGNVLVDGTYEGRIEGVGWVIVGEHAQVTADILARHVRVDGQVRGDIQAVGQVQVGSTGQVWGQVTAAHVLVEPGGAVHAAGDGSPATSMRPALAPAAQPPPPPVEIVRPTRSPARERLRRAEQQMRRPSIPRWALGLGVVALVILALGGTLALSGVLSGAAPSPTPAQIAAGPSATTSGPQTSGPSPAPAPTATPSPTRTPTASPTAIPTATDTPTPTRTPTEKPAPTAAPTSTRPPATPTPTPTSPAPAHPFVPDGPVVAEHPNCAPAVVWLRGQVRQATPEQLQHVQVQVRHPDGRVLTEPVQPDGSYEVRLYSQGPCPVTLVDSRDGTPLSPTVPIEYADTCNGSAFTLHWKRVE